jgi:starch-binding outer membrane protein, SusD/RagB family
MKLNKIRNTVIVAAISILLAACKKDFVTIEPRGQFLSENYYANADQAFSALVATYDPVRKNSGGFENMICMMNAGSDDNYAGGGNKNDGEGIQNFSHFTLNSTTIPQSFWNDFYQGVFRANIMLQRLPETPMDESVKARYLAEAKTLRAWYYFNLLRMFKNIPLILTPLTTADMYSVAQAAPEDVYTQIESDLQEAISVLPPVISSNVDNDERGRLNKGAAQAILGEIYLYNNKKAEAAAQFAEVNGTPGGTNQYGNHLLSNFAELWLVNNKFNAESIFEVCHTNKGYSDWSFWGQGKDEGNSVNIMVGVRNYHRTEPINPGAPDLPAGWTFNLFTQDFYDAIDGDPRKDATLLNLGKMEQDGWVTFDTPPDWVALGYPKYYLNKFMPRVADKTTLPGTPELNYRQNTYAIRLADTYLLEAEALGATGARAQALLDAVRSRVGLASVPVSMDAIKRERRLELAGEGFRFFDLVRWGDASTKLASKGFVAGKNEVFPIPRRELLGTQLHQNPNYD